MFGVGLLASVVALFLIGYTTYARFLSNRFRIDNHNQPPSQTLYDGVDYVPAKSPVLLGHHFASIAGAGPIVGPVIAAAFGWVPVILWIVLGSLFIGGVHDFSAIVASIRHKGKSIASVGEKYLGLSGKRLFLLFSWSSLILVIAVFTNIVADTFTKAPAAATSSLTFLLLAVLFGMAIYRFKVPLWLATLLGVVLLFGGVGLGQIWPIQASKFTWQVLLLCYVFVASITPVWILLQPRDYLNSFLLYALVIGGLVGVICYHPQIHLSAFTTFQVPNLGTLFPILFVTIACGAISGFHSLVASGTTSKQIEKESDARLIGYGGMLIEGVLAALAIVAVASLQTDQFHELYRDKQFVRAFALGLSNFISAIPFLHISPASALNFATLAVSAFALTSLDTATRIARYNFQELCEKADWPAERQPALASNRYLATLVTVGCGALLTFSGKSDAIWPVFGSANQLLAALALLTVTLWLSSEAINHLFTLIPALFMLLMTLCALGTLAFNNFIGANYLLAVIAVMLFLLALWLSFMTFKVLRQLSRQSPVPH
jgi:carbon starvation protein